MNSSIFFESIYACNLGVMLKVSAVTCLSQVSPNSPYLISGGADGVLNLIDLRRVTSSGTGDSMIVRRFGSHTNGVHCMRVQVNSDQSCVFSGDGAGVLHCHSLVSVDQPSLVYGLGASQIGAVKTIDVIHRGPRSGFVITGGDDGKAVSWEF